MEKLRFNLSLIILFFVFTVGVFFRFYRLDKSPLGLYVDEAAIGYNAFSILETGKDEYGKSFPIFFRSFGDYKMPLLIYFLTLPIKIFGLNVFSVRLISAVFGSLSIFLTFLLIRALFPNEKTSLALIASVLFAVSPLTVFFSRMALEASLGLFFLLLGLFLQSKSFDKKSFLLMVLSAVSYALSAYSYHTERFLVPIVYLFSSVIFYFESKDKWSRSLLKTIISLIIFFSLISPQIFLFNSSAGKARIKSFTTSEKIPLRHYLASYFAYFSPRNLFFNPDSDLQRSLPELSVFYPWMIVPFLFGLWVFLKRKDRSSRKTLIIFLLLLLPLPASLAWDPFSSFRAYPWIFPLIVIISFGLDKLVSYGKKLVLIPLIIILLISLANLWRNIFVLLPNERFNNWNFGYSKLGNIFLKENYPKILLDNPLGVSYIEVLFFTRYSPLKYQKESPLFDLKEYYQTGNWLNTFSWDKFEVRGIIWRKDIYENKLIVATPIGISEDQAKEHFLTKVFVIIGPDNKAIFNGYLTNPELKIKDDERREFLLKNESGHL